MIIIVLGFLYNQAQHKYDEIAGVYIPQVDSNADKQIADFLGLKLEELKYDANDYSIEVDASGKIAGSLWYINKNGNFHPGRARIVGSSVQDDGIKYQIKIAGHPDAIVSFTIYSNSEISTYKARNAENFNELVLPYERADSLENRRPEEAKEHLTDVEEKTSEISDEVVVIDNTGSKEQTVPQQAEQTHKHNYVVLSKRDATCTAKGITSWVCHDCGNSYNSEVSASGHTWKYISCDVPRKCSICGTQEEKASGHNWIKKDSQPVVYSRCSQKYPCNVAFKYEPDIIGELDIAPEVRIDSIDISQEAHYGSHDDVIYAYLIVTISGYNSSTYYESVTVDIGEFWNGGGRVEFFIPSGSFNMSEWTLVDDLNGTYYVDVIG